MSVSSAIGILMPRFLIIVLAVFLLLAAVPSLAQDDEVSLGDLARAARKSKPAEEQPQVIDNDNIAVMMDKAESERLNGKPVFSVDPSGKSFRMTSPDGTCSLSFDAKAAALITTPYISSDLPQYELVKLEGGAAVHDGVLEVTLHNGTGWELKEIVVGVTLLNQTAAEVQPARLITDSQIEPRRPDMTTLYHLKATAPAESTMVFKGIVNDDLDQAKDWHWALVAARGIPPAAPATTPVQANAPSVQSGASPVQPSTFPTSPAVQDSTTMGQPTAQTHVVEPGTSAANPSSGPAQR